ncbi:hypothetical protein PA598K_04169 [Paenibacillus sp. 598K]|nr:hypothetical protein PA598K_04169 [Paenibacillus sp. 598K]
MFLVFTLLTTDLGVYSNTVLYAQEDTLQSEFVANSLETQDIYVPYDELEWEEDFQWGEIVRETGESFAPPMGAPGYAAEEGEKAELQEELTFEEVEAEAMMMAMNTYVPNPNILNAIQTLNVKAPQAPYSIRTQQENISTLTGSLTVEATDLSLPGRNGLSFDLTRVYDSSSAEFFEKSHEPFIFCLCRITYDGNKYMEYENPTTGHRYTIPFQNITYIYYDPSILPDIMNNIYDSMGLFQWLTELKDSPDPRVYGKWSNIDSTGYRSREVDHIYGNLNWTNQYTGSEIWPRDKAKEKTDEEKRYPIGKGWSWKIPYIKYSEGGRYLNLFDQGSYQITGSTLKGYPFQDLSVAYDSSVSVNDEWSSTVVKSIHGTKHYFSSGGRLIQISDAYNNTITFHYTDHPTYGKVLTSIKDAINNSIDITYNANEVILQQGDKSVLYTKYNYTTYDPLPPFTQFQTEILSSVRDVDTRTTTYGYSIKDVPFSVIGSSPVKSNPAAMLETIYHPTGAKTVYTYGPSITRVIGMLASQRAFRIASRKEEVAGVASNVQNYTYGTDYASSHGQNISNITVSIDDGLTSTLFNHRKVMNGIEDYPVFYTNFMTQTAPNDEHITTTYTYDETRKITLPIQTKTQFKKGSALATAIQTSRTFDNYGNVLTETDPMGTTKTYTYHPTTKWLASITEPIRTGQSRYTELLRNAQGSVTQVAVKENNASGTVLAQANYENFDTYGNVQRTIIKDDTRDIIYNTEYGSTFSGAYPTKQTVVVTNPTSTGNATQTVTHTLDYFPTTGLVKSYQDGNQSTTSLQYDKLDRLTRITHPDNTYASVTYTNASNQATIREESGVTTRLRWNAIGQLVEEAILDGSYRIMRTLGYDSYGRLSWERALGATNRQTSYTYNNWSEPIKTEAPDGSFSTTDYDKLTRQTVVTDPELNRFRSTTDILGRSILNEEWRNGQYQQVQALAYDHEGNVITETNATDATSYLYDVLGRVTKVTDALGGVYTYAYAKAGPLKTIVYPDGASITKQYDELGRLIQQTNETGQSDTYSYDPNGNVVQHKDRKGQLFTMTYNNRNFLLSKQAPDETVNYTYDAAGRRKSMIDITGTTLYTYKAATGELTQVTYPDNKTIKYTYNTSGLRNTMTDPYGYVLNYSYDLRDRLTAVGPTTTNSEATYTYYKNNLVKQRMLKNGTTSNYEYEGSRLKNLTHQKSNGTGLYSFNYTHDGNSNITAIAGGATGNTTTEAYSYDPLNRVSTASPFNEAYSYDARHNRTTLATDNPSMLDINESEYVYDSQNRLVTARYNGNEVAYRYNGDGLLYERIENGVKTRYYLDGDQMIAEGTLTTGTTAAFKARYVRGHELISRQSNTNSGYYLHNGHGDVIELRDATGNAALNTYSYDLWGNPQMTQETVENPFRYSGEYWDKTTQLQYLRARWYDPGIGRFISKDTYEGILSNPLSLNFYTYVYNNPLINIDPSGNYCVAQNGNWATPGSCSSTNSIYLGDDKNFSGRPIIDNGIIVGKIGEQIPLVFSKGNYWSLYPDDYSYIRWLAGDNDYYYGLDREIQERLRQRLLSNYMGQQIAQGFPDFIDGVLWGASLVRGPGGKFGLAKKGGKQKEGNQRNGTPGDNKRQNEQFNSIANKYKLTPDQRSRLHDQITKKNYSYKEIEEAAKEIAAGRG